MFKFEDERVHDFKEYYHPEALAVSSGPLIFKLFSSPETGPEFPSIFPKGRDPSTLGACLEIIAPDISKVFLPEYGLIVHMYVRS